MKVLCFGSLNMDYTYKVDHLVAKGETLSSDSLQVFAGGKGLNQSIALARAKAEVFHAGSIGEDGMFLAELLKNSGVNINYLTVRKDARTGNAIIQIDKNGDNCIILYGGTNQMITREQVDEVVKHFQAGDFLVLQNEINELGYIMEQAHEKGMKIILNPSPMNEKVLALPLEYVNYFLLNEVEAGQILGVDVQNGFDGEKLVQEVCGRYPGAAVVLTMGSQGAVYADGKETIFQPACKVKAVDTTAAGDTFTGFFLGGLLRGLEVRASLELAAKASAIAVTRPGAAPSIPALEEVESF